MNLFSEHLLSFLIWFPVVGGVLVLATGGDRRAMTARWLALGISVATFIFSIPLWTGFNRSTADMQFVERSTWIERFNIEYF
ncbi:MAG: NADH-quinone oxidoreductase subunit M, partial [Pseudomonadota bacterium]|nr:NADH-quinone oxidoreductase subunit M [Pseudomonadota bacterium]